MKWNEEALISLYVENYRRTVKDLRPVLGKSYNLTV